ncbi:MAG: HAMP domain-containing protein [Candidatus Riflebacteria bacterium]|nr:HAMP domain-containing protein [Candidatus Riflebacteria bacterium]
MNLPTGAPVTGGVAGGTTTTGAPVTGGVAGGTTATGAMEPGGVGASSPASRGDPSPRASSPMGTRLFLAFFWVISLALPSLVAFYEGHAARGLEQEAADEALAESGQRWLETLQRTALSEVKIRRALLDFLEKSEEYTRNLLQERTPPDARTWEKAMQGYYRNHLANWMPPHDLVWVGSDSLPVPARFTVDGGLGLTSSKEFASSRWVDAVTGRKAEGNLGRTLTRILRTPLIFPQRGQIHGFLHVFRAEEGIRGWFCATSRGGALALVVDLDRLDPHLGMRLLTEAPPEEGWEVGFFPRGPGKPLVTPGLRRQPSLVGELASAIPDVGALPELLVVDGRRVFVGDVAGNMAWRAMVLFPPNLAGRMTGGEMAAWAAGLSLVLVLAGWGAWRFLAGGGLRLSVGLVMLWACLWLVLLPLSGIRTVARQATAEFGRTLNQERAQEVHEEMLRLDSGVRFMEAALVNHLKTQARRPDLAARLRKGVSPKVLQTTLKELSWIARPPPPFPSTGALDFMVASDRAGFQAALSFKRGLAEQQASGSTELAAAFGPFLRKILVRAADEPDAPVGGTGGRVGGDPSWKKALEEETFASIMASLLGGQAVLQILNNPGKVGEVKTSHLRVDFLPTLLGPPSRRPESLIFWAYGDWVGFNYLDWKLAPESDGRANVENAPISGLPWNRRALDPASASVRVTDGWMVGVMGEYTTTRTVSPGFEPPASMLSAFEQLRRAELGRRFRDTSLPGQPLMQFMPGFLLPRFMLARLRTTDDLARREAALGGQVAVVSGAFLVLAFALAWAARRRFLEPLQVIQAGVGEIGRGNFSARLDLPTGDEFEAVARAFNAMGMALAEGRILGRYVSETVRRAVQDRSFQEMARRGERREVTVLFSGLLPGAGRAAEEDPIGICAELGRHLDACSEAVAAEGGEIDKVIGEKILMVFDHGRLGDGDQATAAALAVVARVRATLAVSGLTAAMGLDAGGAVAGILGSSQVREDYTVIGDTVNLAARLAALAPDAGGSRVVLSGAILDLAGGRVRAARLPVNRVKGKKREVEAFLLVD